MKKSPSASVRNAAAALAAKVLKGEGRDLAHSERSAKLPDGRMVHRFVTSDRKDPNGPRHIVVLGDDEKEVDAASLPDDVADVLGAFRIRPALPRTVALAGMAASASIEPRFNDLVLELGEDEEEVVTVTIPPNTGVTKADVYLLADNTGSMGDVIDAVKAGANDILNAFGSISGASIAFGVGNYRDYPDTDPPFTHQLAPDTNAANVTAAINAWVADGGGDRPEGQLFALHQLAEAPSGSIGWRPDAKRIIVWFGDAPGHDPICTGFTGLPDITEGSATGRLVGENITVLAISTTNPENALDDNPQPGFNQYNGTCIIGGTPEQATRIAAATGGVHASITNPDEIVDRIIELIDEAIGQIDRLTLEPSVSIAPFVASISPPSYDNLPGNEEHVLPFKVRWRGVKPCGDEDVVFRGALKAIADDVVVARKRVRITVPACPPEFVYAVKYVCGTQDDCGCPEAPVRPGRYATEINIHNSSRHTARVFKRVVPTVSAGIGVAREPLLQEPVGRDVIKLPASAATMDDCKRLAELHYGAPAEGRLPLTIGFLHIVSNQQLVVTAVYTATATEGGLSMDVETIQPIIRPQLPPFRR